MTQNMLEECRRVALVLPCLGVGGAVKLLLDSNSSFASKFFSVPLGKIAPGFAADLVLMDYVPLTPISSINVSGHLIYGAKNVHSVWVAGKIVVQHGQVLGVDKKALFSSMQRATEFVWQSPELNRFPDAPTQSALIGLDFLRTWDFSMPQLAQVLDQSKRIRARFLRNESCAVFANGGLALSNFRDKSTRTRLAFSSGCSLLGLQTFVFEEGSQNFLMVETFHLFFSFLRSQSDCSWRDCARDISDDFFRHERSDSFCFSRFDF